MAGMIVMRVKFDKTGSDVIPNKGFWFALPFLVKVAIYILEFTVTRFMHYYVFLSLKGWSIIYILSMYKLVSEQEIWLWIHEVTIVTI